MNNKARKFIFLLLMTVAFLILGVFIKFEIEGFNNIFKQYSILFSGLLFVFIYCFLSFFIWVGPKDILKIAAAGIYGAYLSTFFVYIAEMINLILLFTLSRKLGREYVETKIKGKASALDETISSTGFWSIFALRIFPIVPFRFLDLAFGLTKIRLARYLGISMIASLPRLFFVQFFLSLGLETVMNPTEFNKYFMEHPLVMNVSFVYLLFAIAAVFLWKRKTMHSR